MSKPVLRDVPFGRKTRKDNQYEGEMKLDQIVISVLNKEYSAKSFNQAYTAAKITTV